MLATTTLAKGLLVVGSLLGAPGDASEAVLPAATDSYTRAYNQAEGRSMLVVLNPSADAGVDTQTLRQDDRVAAALDGFVVAEIDASSQHGQQVRELFGNPALPHVVVISPERKQIYKTSGYVTADQLLSAIGEPSQPVTVTAERPVYESVQQAAATSSISQPVVSEPIAAAPMAASSYVPQAAPVSQPAIALPTSLIPQMTAPPTCTKCQKARQQALQMGFVN